MAETIQVKVLYFQSLRKIAGLEGEDLVIPGPSTVADLMAHLGHLHPALTPLVSSILIAVNERHAKPVDALKCGDIVALMPPFSGG
jgi:molybdopterin converting factor small subunit